MILFQIIAEEWRGEKGVERLESRIGKPIEELSRADAEKLSRADAEMWIDRLTPKDSAEAAE